MADFHAEILCGTRCKTLCTVERRPGPWKRGSKAATLLNAGMNLTRGRERQLAQPGGRVLAGGTGLCACCSVLSVKRRMASCSASRNEAVAAPRWCSITFRTTLHAASQPKRPSTRQQLRPGCEAPAERCVEPRAPSAPPHHVLVHLLAHHLHNSAPADRQAELAARRARHALLAALRPNGPPAPAPGHDVVATQRHATQGQGGARTCARYSGSSTPLTYSATCSVTPDVPSASSS